MKLKIIPSMRRSVSPGPAPEIALARLGRLRLAERFSGPANLAVVRIPLGGLGDLAASLEHGIRIFLLTPDGAWRALHRSREYKGTDSMTLGFVPFNNSEPAIFGFLVFDKAGTGHLDAVAQPIAAELTVMQKALVNRPPMELPCNRDAPFHERMRIPLFPLTAISVWEGSEPQQQEEQSTKDDDQVAWWVDRAWRERGDCFIQGWIHAYRRRIMGVRFETPAGLVLVVEHFSRPDLLTHYPMLPDSAANAGFMISLSNVSGGRVRVLLDTDDGILTTTIIFTDVPPDSTAKIEQERRDHAWKAFIDEVNERNLEVMELGSRIVGPNSVSMRNLFPGAAQFIGVDIHPSEAVDIVADAHRLSQDVGTCAVDAVFSVAVLEHLAMPWIAATEMNRTLRMGGLCYHVTPQTWPVHEQPNDFWRFTDEALRLLFGPGNGFKILASGMCDRMRIYTEDREGGDAVMPFNPGFGSAYVLARKVEEVGETTSGSGMDSVAMTALSQRYPNREPEQ